MIKKTKERKKAIELRKQGLSYREILGIIPVAKSSLSLWLRSVGLSKRQKQRLTKKKLAAALRGARQRKVQKINITKEIKEKAKKEIGRISKKNLLLIGTVLYWGEGDKEKDKSSQVSLGNSDPYLIKLFIKWLMEICEIPKEDIYFRIYLHKTAEKRLSEIKSYWSEITNFPIKEFQNITWKKHKIRTKRKNIGKDYKGLLKVTVKRSANLNRRIAGWIEGICEYCRVV